MNETERQRDAALDALVKVHRRLEGLHAEVTEALEVGEAGRWMDAVPRLKQALAQYGPAPVPVVPAPPPGT